MDEDDLYGLPLERFVPERTALSRALRSERKRDEAAAVAGLRKPSVAAWAVNQLVRTQRDAVAELFDAGDALRDAQSDLLAGRGDGRRLRAASERERAAVDHLVDRARGLLSADGAELSPAVVQRVADTLHAASLDADAREQVRAGRLERELRHAGLGLGFGESMAVASPAARPQRDAVRPSEAKPPRAARKTPERGGAKDDEQQPERRKQAKRDEREERERGRRERVERERERAAERKAARSAEAAARRHADRTVRVLRTTEERRDAAARALEEADGALEAARCDAAAAAQAHRQAQASLAELKAPSD